MNKVGTAFVEVRPDMSGFSRSVGRELDGAKSGIKGQMSGFAKSAAAGLAAGAAVGVGLIAKNAISAASDVNESLSKNAKLFGRYAKDVEEFASTSAKSYGISKKAALEYTGVFGNLFRALGQSEKAASGNSVTLTKLAADMASFNNTSVEDALEAIRSGLVGETEPLRKFGVNMNDATLKAQALRMGLIKSTKDALDPQTKAIAAQALIMKQTSQAHGDFEDTSGSLANQQKILKARFDDASAALGARLLPFAVKGANALNDLLTAAQNGSGVFGTLKGIWDGVAGAFSGGGESGGKLKGVIDNLISSSQGLVDIGVALWERFGGVLTAQAENLVRTWGAVLTGVTQALGGLIDFVAGVFTGDWDRAWDGIKAIFDGVWKAMLATVVYTLNTLKNVANVALLALASIVKGIWAGIKAATSAAWNGIRDAVLVPIRFARDQMESIGGGIANRLGASWSAVKGAASEAWAAIRDTILTPLRSARDAVPDIVGGIANRVAAGWKIILGGARDFGGNVKDAIVGAFKDAAGKVLGFVRSIVSVVNKLPGVDIKLAQGGVASAAGVETEGFATGGEVRRGMRLTKPIIMMGEEAPKHPEFVVPTNPAYRKRALGLYAQLGQELGVGGQGFVDGYAEGGVLGTLKKAVTAPLSLITKGASWLLGKLPDPAKVLPNWLQGLGKHVIDKVGGWIKDKFETLIPAGGSAGGPGVKSGTNALAAALARKFGLSITSGYRDPQHNAAVGGVPGSSHTKGSPANPGAHDFVPPNSAALRYAVDVLKAKWADIHDFGSGPHLHVSWFRKGGVLGAPFVGAYANGGVVPQDGYGYLHGGETVVPKTGSLFDGAVFHLVMGGQVIDERIELKIVENGRRSGAMMRAGVLA